MFARGLTPAGHLAAWIVSAVFVYTGFIHLWQPFYYANAIAAYGLAPDFLIALAAVTLPSLQIIVGLALVRRTAGRAPAVVAIALLLVFTAAQVNVLVSGESIACGCFGFQSKEIGAETVAFNFGLVLLACLSLVANWPRSNQVLQITSTRRVLA